LYAIVDRMPAAWRPPTNGLGDASVVPRRVDDVVVIGSLLETVPPATPRTLAIHHDIVATVLDAGALLPLRYGTAVAAATLHDWFAAHRAVLDAALGSVRGCVEMSVKLLRLDGALDGRQRGGESGPGARQLQALADALVERAALPQWRYRPSGTSGNVAASIAFLVPRSDQPGFLARIAPVASHATGVAVVPTGPWPPYSFVPDLERAPLARVPAAAGDTVDRRAS
ncbi:MAG TPA: GvpL/GvpF family gas vesicle protein, partial [Solirubrobacteraceae bacterium]